MNGCRIYGVRSNLFLYEFIDIKLLCMDFLSLKLYGNSFRCFYMVLLLKSIEMKLLKFKSHDLSELMLLCKGQIIYKRCHVIRQFGINCLILS